MLGIDVPSQGVGVLPDSGAETGCCSCPRRRLCPIGKLSPRQRSALSVKIPRQRTVTTGQQVTRAGNQFDGIYIVRTGFFKSCLSNQDGEQQVTAFHLPGEIFGVEGIGSGIYLHSTEALEAGSVCRIPAQLLLGSGVENQPLVQLLIKHMSQVILRDSEMIFSLARMSATRRLASFLIDFAMRMRQAGFREDELILFMSRTDIGSYLGLAEETVCRLFTHLKRRKILKVNRRCIQDYDLEKLQGLAGVGVPVESLSYSVGFLSMHT